MEYLLYVIEEWNTDGYVDIAHGLWTWTVVLCMCFYAHNVLEKKQKYKPQLQIVIIDYEKIRLKKTVVHRKQCNPSAGLYQLNTSAVCA